jgi:hypothetical protein
MGNGERIDRRATGVQRVVVHNGNGLKDEMYSVNVTRAKTWLGMLATALTVVATVIGGVWAGVQFGISSEVHSEVERECKPGGHIDQAIQRTADEHLEEIQGVLQDDLDDFDDRFRKQHVELQEQHDLGIRLEERQIAIQVDVDEKHQELLRAIQQASGGGG